MRVLGWIVVGIGLTWILGSDFADMVNTKNGWSDEMGYYNEDRTYTREEVFQAMHRTSRAILRHDSTGAGGGITMLVGTLILEVARQRTRK